MIRLQSTIDFMAKLPPAWPRMSVYAAVAEYYGVPAQSTNLVADKYKSCK